MPQRDLDRAVLCGVRLEKNATECLRLLLEAGGSANAQDNSGNTVLKIAVENGSANMAKLLLEAGASADIGHGQRGTALHYAARHNHGECAAALLNAGAFPNSRDSQGNTPLIAAAQNKCTLVIKELIKGKCDLNLKDSIGRTALHYACQKAVGADMLLKAGAAPDLQDEDGNSPIHVAATEGFDAVIKCLLEAGANPNLTNCFQKTALHYLAMKNHWEGMTDLIEHGANTQAMDSEGNTALWYAVFRNRTDAVKALLRANCFPDPHKSANGSWIGGNPLQTALAKKLFDVAKLLILAGCHLLPLYTWIDQVENERKEQKASRWYLESDEEEEEEVDEELEAAILWFEEWLHRPHTLQQLCRMAVRCCIGHGLLAKQQSLPVPQSIIDYITLKEVDDHHVVAVLV